MGVSARNLSGERAPEGFWVHDTPTRLWYHCFLVGTAQPRLRCEAGSSVVDGARCGLRACDYDRQTFQTSCVSTPGNLWSNKHCLYVGHFGELRPFDVMGKPTPYEVYVMAAPPLA